jgi:hypothetical protein
MIGANYPDCRDLDNLLIKFINFICPIEYVSDSYFDAEKVFEYRYDLPQWNYNTTTSGVQHIDLGENMQAIKALAFIALQSEGVLDSVIFQAQKLHWKHTFST